jgi:probable HAF family extracellular repeat protein
MKSDSSFRCASSLLLFTASCLAYGTNSSTIQELVPPNDQGVQVNGLNQAGNIAGFVYVNGFDTRAWLYQGGVFADLGSCDDNTSAAWTLNNSGQMAGDLTLGDATHAFLYSNDNIIDLGTLGGSYSTPTAINNVGQVIGYSLLAGDTDYGAFLYSNGEMVNLGTLGGTDAFAYGINDSGMVVGISAVANGNPHGFVYSNGVMYDVGTLGGTRSKVLALNNSGLVVGDSRVAPTVTHALTWQGGRTTDLGTLGGVNSSAFAVNDAGQVLGTSDTPEGYTHSFIYQNGTMTDLGTLGGNYCEAWALNNLGQVVGISETALGVQHAFLWSKGKMTDLNTVLPPNSGWTLVSANFINDASRIVGYGTQGAGLSEYFILDLAQDNQAPLAVLNGPGNAVECPAEVSLDGTASSDPDGDTLTFEWRTGQTVLGTDPQLKGLFPIGNTVVTLKVTDPSGASAETNFTVQVVDGTAPQVSWPQAITVSPDANCQATIPNVVQQVIATDTCASVADLAIVQSPEAGTLVGAGQHTITVTVTDPSRNQASGSVLFTVPDPAPPVFEMVTASPDVLSPPNHAMVPVTISAKAVASCGPAPECKIVNVTCNEAVAPSDIQITGALKVSLAASKSASGGTRLYTISVQATDVSGNSTLGTVTVTVAKSNGNGNGPAHGNAKTK